MSLSDGDDDAPAPAAAGPWWSRKPSASTIALGSSAALAFALLLGLLLSPSLERAPPGVPDRAALRPTSRAPAVRIPAEVSAPAAVDVPPQPPAPAPAASAVRTVAPPPPPPATASVRRAAAREEPVAQPPALRAENRQDASRATPSFNCRYARTTAELMVCDDPALAAADRRLAEAYRNAVRAGAPEPYLRRAQDRWLDVRENAAPDPEAVAAVYERRIEELDALSR